MSTSSEARQLVMRGLPVDAVATADTTHDLRDGAWTRFGGDRVRGDRATEATLRGLAERSHDAARAQGFAAGWAEGLRAASSRADARRDEEALAFEQAHAVVLEQQASAAAALVSAVARCEETTRALRSELHDAAVELALQLAEALLGRELALAEDPAADAVRRAVAGVPGDVPLVVRLHPDDLAVLDREVLGERTATATVVADAGVARGDAVVETLDGFVDADLAGALARVREVLGR
jgi:flagellar assembly protein FliH